MPNNQSSYRIHGGEIHSNIGTPLYARFEHPQHIQEPRLQAQVSAPQARGHLYHGRVDSLSALQQTASEHSINTAEQSQLHGVHSNNKLFDSGDARQARAMNKDIESDMRVKVASKSKTEFQQHFVQ